MHEFIDLYLRHHVAQLTVAKEMTATIHRYFPPLHARPLTEITPLQIEEWFHQIGAISPSMANKCLSIMRTMFERAKDWRLFVGESPAQRVKKYSETARERFVQDEEMPHLLAALRARDEVTQCYFLLCLLVACRRTEGLTMRWIDLDIPNCRWHKPKTKTRQNKTRRGQNVPIPLALMGRLSQLPHTNEFVFATKKGHWSTSLAFERWDLIRSQAGIPDVTIHDLRRTCASWLASNGVNIAVIGNVLNHSGLQHTAIYARSNLSPVTRALEENSARMLPPAINPLANRTVTNGADLYQAPVMAQPIAPAVEHMEWPG
jgi:integrase